MEGLMQLFLVGKSHFNDVAKQAKTINAKQALLLKQIQI